jgi:hypothetical protein
MYFNILYPISNTLSVGIDTFQCTDRVFFYYLLYYIAFIIYLYISYLPNFYIRGLNKDIKICIQKIKMK